MTGYLGRLARRALGTEPPVHAVGATPFTEPAVIDPPDLLTAPSVQPSVRSLHETALESAPERDLGVRAPAATVAAVAPVVLDLRPVPLTTAEVVAAPDVTADAAAAVMREREFVPLMRQRVVEASPAAPARIIPARRVPTPSAERRERPSLPRSVETNVGREPASLRQQGASASDEETASAVHVHIGRIEVTAVNPPVAPKRATQPRPKPASLSAYLDARSGKSR